MKALASLILGLVSLSAFAQSSSADVSAEDVAEIRSAPAPERNALPWYHPSVEELPAAPGPKQLPGTLSLATRAFALNTGNVPPFGSLPFPDGVPSGGFALFMQSEGQYFKTMLGFSNFGGNFAFLVGGGAGGNLGLRLINKPELEIAVLAPEVELGLSIRADADGDPAPGMWVGINPIGARVMICPFKADVRLHIGIDSTMTQYFGPHVGLAIDLGMIFGGG